MHPEEFVAIADYSATDETQVTTWAYALWIQHFRDRTGSAVNQEEIKKERKEKKERRRTNSKQWGWEHHNDVPVLRFVVQNCELKNWDVIVSSGL